MTGDPSQPEASAVPERTFQFADLHRYLRSVNEFDITYAVVARYLETVPAQICTSVLNRLPMKVYRREQHRESDLNAYPYNLCEEVLDRADELLLSYIRRGEQDAGEGLRRRDLVVAFKGRWYSWDALVTMRLCHLTNERVNKVVSVARWLSGCEFARPELPAQLTSFKALAPDVLITRLRNIDLRGSQTELMRFAQRDQLRDVCGRCKFWRIKRARLYTFLFSFSRFQAEIWYSCVRGSQPTH